LKNIIFLIVGVAATLGIISATAVTNQVFATTAEEDLPDCPDGNPCKKTDTDTEELNPGLDKETTTVSEESCKNRGGNFAGDDGTKCPSSSPSSGQTQSSEEISSDCDVVAKKARQGEGQTTGRQC
jgi:hypothetical protein